MGFITGVIISPVSGMLLIFNKVNVYVTAC